MNTSQKRILKAALIFLFLSILIIVAVYLKNVSDYKRAVKETTITAIDISEVPDGTYIGAYDVNFIYAKVEVTVQNGEIKDIRIIEHKNERGQSAEAILSKIIDTQRIDVDAISGATNSSTVIKKAVENALTGS